jgi:hypothetical protein
MAEEDAAATKDYRAKQLGMQERTMAIAEKGAARADQKHEWESQEQERSAAARQQLADLAKQHYSGDVKPGMDATVDMKYGAGMLALTMQNGKMDPKEWASFQKDFSAMRESEQGKKFMAALQGGQQSPEFQELARAQGLDPTKAKFDMNSLSLSDGKNTVDIKLPMMILGGAMGSKFVDSHMQLATHKSNLTKAEAQTTASLASANNSNAAAGNQSASAEQTRVETGNLKAGLPKDGARAKVADNAKVARDLLTKSKDYEFVPISHKADVWAAVQKRIEGGQDPDTAVLRTLAQYQKNVMGQK